MHPAEKYAHDVRNGSIVTGLLIKLAVDRYFDDLETGIDRGLYFDRKAAEKACAFFPKVLKHSKDEWYGKPFTLEPWQAFGVWNIFGWKKADGSRRFSSAYIQVARKNGKSTYAAGYGLKMMVADGVMGAEIYVGATKLKQAYVTFREAANMVKASPVLKQFVTPFQHNLHSEELNAKFEPLASDSDKQDGLSPYCGIIDEYHAHRTNELYNVLESGMGARTSPLMFVITTAGFNKNSPCYKMRDIGIKILKRVIEQDNRFVMIFELDEKDDWEDSSNWIKANPSIQSIGTIKRFLEDRFSSVKNDPTLFVDFMTKNLNKWMNADKVWIEDERWMENAEPVTWEMMKGRTCYAGLDLSSISDITSLFLIAEEAGRFLLCPFFFVPELTASERIKKDNVPYDVWIREGYIEETEGDIIDYDYIRRRVSGYYVADGVVQHDPNCIADNVNLVRIGFDRWNSSQLVNNLTGDGITMSNFGQGYASMSTPTKEFKKYALRKAFAHGGNPVLRWMISNVSIKRDPAGNEKPDKEKSNEKIDGVVAGIMALGEYLTDNAGGMEDIYLVRTV